MPTQASFEACQRIYKTMEEEATTRTIDGLAFLTWEGYTTKLISRLGYPTPYYSKLLGALRQMDCIRQARRGGGAAPSLWILMQPPNLSLWQRKDDAKVVTAAAGTPRRTALEALSAVVGQIGEQVTKVTAAFTEQVSTVTEVVDVLENLNQRITVLEEKLDRLSAID